MGVLFFFCFCDMCYDVEVVMLFKFIDASYRLVEICNCQCVDEYGHAVALDDMCCHIFANVNVDCVNNKANQKLTVLIIPFHYYFFFFAVGLLFVGIQQGKEARETFRFC